MADYIALDGFYQSFTALGRIVKMMPRDGTFTIKLLTGDEISCLISRTTYYEILRNANGEYFGEVNPVAESIVTESLGERVLGASVGEAGWWNARKTMLRYLAKGRLVCVQGILGEASRSDERGAQRTFDARRVVLMGVADDECNWEQGHWWVHQTTTLFEQWLDVLFENRRDITVNDFAEFYRTNLDSVGDATSNTIQESATMSRFLYGLSSSYLLTGNPRALSAARACAAYLIDAYSDIREGQYCLWKFGRVRDGRSTKQIYASQFKDDLGTYAIYEQIYAISGLAQYYRITQDVWVLGFIRKTIEAFNKYFRDDREGFGGYYSHIDYSTLSFDSAALDATGNRKKKNWNSIGDHIPAYLINLLLAIDPIPVSNEQDDWESLLETCRRILDDCVSSILDHFAPEEGTVYVQERFDADWNADRSWGWQQDRAIVGHNLKISWNLTRCGHYYATLAAEAEQSGSKDDAARLNRMSSKCYEFAERLGKSMISAGVDLVRGGIFDAVERHPRNGAPIEFAWDSTKDFWQQEQAILAYYIMHGAGTRLPNEACERGESDSQAVIELASKEESCGPREIPDFLEVGRACAAFWNLFFLDRDGRKVFFRTNEAGVPILSGEYGIQAGHAIAGYHAFELSFLAHIYTQTYVSEASGAFNLFFCPVRFNSSVTTLNVCPDFFSPGAVEVAGLRVNGLPLTVKDKHSFQIDISGTEKYGPDSVFEVEFQRAGTRSAPVYSGSPMGAPSRLRIDSTA